MWVGSEISCCKPKVVVSESICEPSLNIVSSFHYDSDLALKSLSISTKDDLGWLI